MQNALIRLRRLARVTLTAIAPILNRRRQPLGSFEMHLVLYLKK
jgi:hypothetical protein